MVDAIEEAIGIGGHDGGGALALQSAITERDFELAEMRAAAARLRERQQDLLIRAEETQHNFEDALQAKDEAIRQLQNALQAKDRALSRLAYDGKDDVPRATGVQLTDENTKSIELVQNGGVLVQDQRILETLKERLNALEENLNMEVERRRAAESGNERDARRWALELAAMKEENQQLKNDLWSKQTVVSDLERDNQRLQVAMLNERSAAEHIEEVDAQLRSRESALTEANSRAEEYRRKLFTANEQLKEAAEELREVKRSQEELIILRQSFERCRKDNADAEQTIEQLSTRLRDADEQLKSLRDKETDTRSLVRDMWTKDKRIDYLNEQVEELKAKLSSSLREKDDYKRHYDQQISDMENRIRKVAAKGKEASQRAQQLEKKLETEKINNHQLLENEKQGCKKTIGKLREDMKRLEMDRHRELASSEALRVELQRTADVLKSANERLQSDLGEEVKKRNQTGKKVEDLYSKTRSLEQEKKELKSMVVELESCFQKIYQESIDYDHIFPEWIE